MTADEALKRPKTLLYGLLVVVLSIEWITLRMIHIQKEQGLFEKDHEPLKIALVYPQPPKAAPVPPPPKPVSKMVKKVVKKSVRPKRMVPPTLPPEMSSSENVLAAASGQRVSLGWSESLPVEGTPSDYAPPRLLSKVDTSRLYTQKMKDSDEEGDVVIKAWIDKRGYLTRYKILIPSVYDDINKSSIDVMKTLRFQAATYQGKPVEGQFQLNFRYRIQNM